MSFLKKLFGAKEASGPEAEKPAKATAEIEYKGFVIKATPFQERGQFQTAGLIEREIGGVQRSHRFIRADRSPNIDEVTETALVKGRLMVDQLGEGLFD